MRKRIVALEITKETSQNEFDEILELLELLSKRYHFKWARTLNPNWVRALAEEMEKEIEEG